MGSCEIQVKSWLEILNYGILLGKTQHVGIRQTRGEFSRADDELFCEVDTVFGRIKSSISVRCLRLIICLMSHLM